MAIGGHDSGLGATSIGTVSDGTGRFSLQNVFADDYTDLYFAKPGFQELTTGVTVVPSQTTTRTIKPLRRDYASGASGGNVDGWTGPDYSGDGCGPRQAIDDDKGTVWSTSTTGGAKDLVVNLGRELDISGVRIDPRAGCGDEPGSSLAQYELAASNGVGQPYETIAGGTIGPLDARGYATLSLAGDLTGRRYLRLRAVAPVDPAQGFMDVAEIEVTGTPSIVATPTPSATPTPTPTPPPGGNPQVVPTRFQDSKLKATRKGVFKVKLRFGTTARTGTARLRVLIGKKRVAEGTLGVRPSRTSTKTLRLSSAGRRQIKPGKSRRVTLELRLPGGDKVKTTVRLARGKR